MVSVNCQSCFRDMWKNVFKKVPPQDIPIIHITNGVIFRAIFKRSVWAFFLTEYFLDRAGEGGGRSGTIKKSGKSSENPNTELWRTWRRRESLVGFVRTAWKAAGRRGWHVQSGGTVCFWIRSFDVGFCTAFCDINVQHFFFVSGKTEKSWQFQKIPVSLFLLGKLTRRITRGKNIKGNIQLCKEEPSEVISCLWRIMISGVARYMFRE